MNNLVRIILFLAIFQFGCENIETDEDHIFLGEYSISDSTKINFPYQEFSKIIVSDSLGVEYEGKVMYDSTYFNSAVLRTYVDENSPLIYSNYSWSYEQRSISINFEEIGVGIDIYLGLVGRLNEDNVLGYGELLRCVISEWNRDSWWTSVELFNNFSLNPPLILETQYYDSIIINNEVFREVYGKEDSYNLYYNNEIGIVGFIEFVPYGTYKFERLE